MRLDNIEELVTMAIKTVKERELEALQMTCDHENLTVSTEEASIGAGFDEERLVKIRVYNCLSCRAEWSEDVWQG